MIDIKRGLKSPRLMKALTGLLPEEFERLKGKFALYMSRSVKGAALGLFLGILWTCAPPPKYIPLPPAPKPRMEIALVRGKYANALEACLRALGLPYARLSQEDLTEDTLKVFRMVVVPYLPESSDTVLDGIEAFVRDGGKLMLFYSLPDRLAEVLGVRMLGYLRQEYEGQFSEIRFGKDRPPGLPERVRQSSWNIYIVEPTSPEARVLARWYDRRGRDTGYPALVYSPTGCYMSHVLLEGDLEDKTLMLAGLVGHFLPDLWPTMARGAFERIGRVGGFQSLEALGEAVASLRRSKAPGLLRAAEELRAWTARYIREGRYPKALSSSLKARRKVVEAYAEVHPSREGELRGIWLHSAFGVADWGWKKTAQMLARSGFNAIFANMLWGSMAHYPSEVLPVSEQAREEGDQIAEAVKWCHRYGLEFHVWMVNNYLGSRPPEDFLEKLRAEGRLQRSWDGKELPWLCPSHPENRRMEKEALLEVVRRYPVDGVHFDYIRYPGAFACYCEGCRERFQRDTGIKVGRWPDDVISGQYFADFQAWRREQVTRLVREVSREVRRIRPDVKISAAVFSNWTTARFHVGQDWKLWVDKGYLDFVCPMNYTTDPGQFREWVSRQVEWTEGKIPLYPGIGAYKMVGGEEVLYQVALARATGADGFVLFSYTPRAARDFFPLLRRGATKAKTSPPHRWDWASFRLPEGLGGYRYSHGDPIRAEVELDRFLGGVRDFQAVAVLERSSGTEVRPLGVLWPGQSSLSVLLNPPPGTYRIAVQGWIRKGWWRKERFAVRSPAFRVLSSKEVAEAFPSLPEEPGVGVYVDGWGGRGILEAFREEDVPAFPVRDLSTEELTACRVLVLAQPRDVLIWDGEVRSRVRDWVEVGGGLLATHDAVGYRRLAPPFPEVARGKGRLERRRWRVVRINSGFAPLDLDKWFSHSYYDHITLAPGPEGVVLAVDEAGEAVVVAGTPGRGRYIACGLALGLGPDDQDRPPEGAELELLMAAMRWLWREPGALWKRSDMSP